MMYTVVESDDWRAFVNAVESHLKQGWILQGGVGPGLEPLHRGTLVMNDADRFEQIMARIQRHEHYGITTQSRFEGDNCADLIWLKDLIERSGIYPVTCDCCQTRLLSCDAVAEEGDRWECLPCWDQQNEKERKEMNL